MEDFRRWIYWIFVWKKLRECSCYGEREKKQKMAKKCKFIQEESSGGRRRGGEGRVRRNRQRQKKWCQLIFLLQPLLPIKVVVVAKKSGNRNQINCKCFRSLPSSKGLTPVFCFPCPQVQLKILMGKARAFHCEQ